jgi:hypothetical protein
VAATLAKEASGLFSTAVFRPIMRGEAPNRANLLVTRVRSALALDHSVSNQTVVSAAYDAVCKDYRSEYFYKNLIASKIFVGRHRAANSVLLPEFRVHGSVADCVLINGLATVYEIKTEFDSPEKLERQLESYYRAFAYVNVVAHTRDAARYEALLSTTPTGLITVGPGQHLSTVKAVVPSFSSFDIKTMFDSLRLHEVTSILARAFGKLPNVPNGLRYATYLEHAQQMSPRDFQREMQGALKRRRLRNCQSLMLDRSSVPMRALLVQLDPDLRQQRNLMNWLASKER